MDKNQLPVVAVTGEGIIEKIFIIRGQKVMLDKDLAEMYGVELRTLNQSVKRNLQRFPEDFMFQLTKEEYESSRSQIVILNKTRGSNLKYLPYAFTEQGVAMLSSVLRSETAIQVNIQIIRVFTKMKPPPQPLQRRGYKTVGQSSFIIHSSIPSLPSSPFNSPSFGEVGEAGVGATFLYEYHQTLPPPEWLGAINRSARNKLCERRRTYQRNRQ